MKGSWNVWLAPGFLMLLSFRAIRSFQGVQGLGFRGLGFTGQEGPYTLLLLLLLMELGPKNHNGDGLSGPNSIMVVYMDPLGGFRVQGLRP